ncbi:MAG: hypothetical protein AAGA68_27195 [Pseudomonadota bacterium]
MHTGPVERLLAQTPAVNLIGSIRPKLGGELPWSFTYGARAKRHSMRLVLMIMAVILLGSAIAVILTIRAGWDPQRMMALSLVAYLVLSMAVPKLIGRKKRGGTGWERQVMIGQTHVRVIDRHGERSTQWRQPLNTYRDLRHRVVSVGGTSLGGRGAPTQLDVVELRHRNPGRTIYLHGARHANATAREGLGGMIEAGRETEDAAAPAPPDGPDEGTLQRMLNDWSETLGLPVSREAE